MATLAAFATVPLASAGAAALADDPVPKPSSCAGFAAEDGSDDQKVIGVDPAFSQPAPANTDITGVFFRYAKGSGATPVLTANIQVKDLDKELFAGSPSTEWRVRYSNDADPETFDERVAGARVDAQGKVTFFEDSFYLDDDPGSAVETTTGQLYEGPDGVVEIVIPASRQFGGKTLHDVFAETYVKTTPTDRDGIAFDVDYAPDTGFGMSFTVVPCLADDADPTPTPDPNPDPDPDPGPDPDGTATPPPDPSPTPPPDPPPPPAQEPTPPPSGSTSLPPNPPAGTADSVQELELTVRPRSVRANRARRGRTLRLVVSAREPLRKLTAALTKRSRVVGRAKLARLSRRGVLRLRPTSNLSRGSYSLKLSATRADGSRGRLIVKIRVR